MEKSLTVDGVSFYLLVQTIESHFVLGQPQLLHDGLLDVQSSAVGLNSDLCGAALEEVHGQLDLLSMLR